MVKKKKKSNIVKSNQPKVIKLQASNRSKIGQWWHDKKKIIIPILRTGAIIILIIWLVIVLIQSFTTHL